MTEFIAVYENSKPEIGNIADRTFHINWKCFDVKKIEKANGLLNVLLFFLFLIWKLN